MNQLKQRMFSVVLEECAKRYNVTLEELLSTTRKMNIIEARHMAIYILRENLLITLKEIGHKLGGYDHTTIIHAHKKIGEFMDWSDVTNEDYFNICSNISKRIV